MVPDLDNKLQSMNDDDALTAQLLWYQSFAPHRVKGTLIEEVKEQFGAQGHHAILCLFAWVSLEVSKHIGIHLAKALGSDQKVSAG